jgi:hypothetical protein
MNFMDKTLPVQREAKLKYLDADYQILREGDFVRCVVSGDPIKLENLRYWHVVRQVAFRSAETSFHDFLVSYQKTQPTP